MIIYNPNNEKIITKRLEEAEQILDQIPTKYCFITGSFLYKEKYKDIDVFVISRTKKEICVHNKKVVITIIDFNDLYSLFYYSISKSCVAKNILPVKPLKVTFADYWHVINEAVPTIFNRRNKFHKDIRFLVLYTEYFKSGNVLDTYQLNKIIKNFKNRKVILEYLERELPGIIKNKRKESYLRRFLYTQAGVYKDLRKFDAQNFLYNLTHTITRSLYHG